ncbi:MAG: hypothetical protein SFV22_03930 [Saprospiraceae bacterium]|nr:hypothetical protein [Saprospiraceae bacterium]
MNHSVVYSNIRQIISQGDTAQALQTLITHLEADGSQAEHLHTLRVVEANFNAVRQQELKGLLGFQDAQREYARANDALLAVLDHLQSGRKPVVGLQGTGDGRVTPPWVTWLIGGVVVLAIGFLFGVWLRRQNKAQAVQEPVPGIMATPEKKEAGTCPVFQANRFKVMIVKFQNLGSEQRKPELSVQTRIRELTANNQLPTDVEIYSHPDLESSTPDLSDATTLGKRCMANMVIWGQFEPLPENAISVDIRYAFTDDAWPPGAAIQTFKNVSEIKTDRMKINQLDDAIFRICTAVALHENRMDLAAKWLNKLKEPTPREQKWKAMLNNKKG